MNDPAVPNAAPRWRWLWILAAVAALDLAIRFGVAFRMPEVGAWEAALFAGGAFALYLTRRRTPPAYRLSGRLQIALILALALAAERLLLWRAGAAMSIANLATLVTALGVLIVWLVRRRRTQHASPT